MQKQNKNKIENILKPKKVKDILEDIDSSNYQEFLRGISEKMRFTGIDDTYKSEFEEFLITKF